MPSPTDGFVNVNGFDVHAWSVSGIETNVVVKPPNGPMLAFDIGYATRPSVQCEHVFVSHGHADHVSGLLQHASKRLLYNWAPATYYVPPHTVDNLKKMCEANGELSEKPALKQVSFSPLPIGKSVMIGRSHRVVPFETFHTVKSQGYLVYRQDRRLKPEFEGKPAEELTALVRSGRDIKQIVEWPEVAFTGDTLFDVFVRPSYYLQDILRVKLLIVETTYLDSTYGSSVEKARDRGHIHIFELRDNAELFRDVGSIVLIHFSDKYKLDDIVQLVRNAGLPNWLLAKIYLGLNFFSVW